MLTYCHGGGGSWLGNLIWHLYNNEYTPSTQRKNSVFDKNPIENPLAAVGHALEYTDQKVIVYDTWSEYQIVKYGTEYPFQLYLNEVNKVRFAHLNYASLPLAEQFDGLTNTGKAWMTDTIMHEYYCKNLDLDMRLLFVDAAEFINQLFAILDTRSIPYSKNIDYCMQSIKQYKSSCPNPKNHIGNMNSLLWLSWCHALKMIHKLHYTSNINFTQIKEIDEIAQNLLPIQEQCLELSKPWYFLWNENE